MIAIDWESILPQWLGEALPLGVIVTDDRLMVRYWSPWLREQTGLDAEAATEQSMPELLESLGAPDLRHHFRRALGGETCALRQREFGYLLPAPAPPNPAGLERMQQRAEIAPLIIDDQIVGTVMVISDMTERAAQDLLHKQTIGRLDETLALLDTLITKAPIGFAFVDTELRYRGINERLAEFNGVPVAGHLGRTIWEIVPALADQQAPLFMQVIESGQPLIDVEISGETKASPGLQRIWEVSYYPVRTADQRRLGVGMLVNEITDRRRIEARERFMGGLRAALTSSINYQATLEAVARATLPYLADWCVIHTAETHGEGPSTVVAHVDPEQEILARRLQRLLPQPLAPGSPLSAVLRSGRSRLTPTLSDESLAAYAADEAGLELLRRLRPASNLLVPLTIGGVSIGVIALTRCAGRAAYSEEDLALAEELAQQSTVALENARLFAVAERSRAMAEEAVRVRDAFFSIAAHELRTPLTTLLGRSQLMQKWLAQDEGGDQRTLRSMGIIVEQAQRLNRMITALLDVSRIQAGRFSIEPARVDLATLVRRVVEETRTTLSPHTLRLHDEGCPLVLLGDEVRLEQVIQNLLSNAVKYSPAGGAVEVELSCHDGAAYLKVSDSGIGIPPEAHEQLFRRFFRAANAERLGISGLGIGLFVVNEIISLHGGRISVESSEGEGSAFTVTLPLMDPEDTSPAEQAPATAEA